MEKINEISTLMFKDFPDCVGVSDLQKMLGIKRTKSYELLKSGTIKSIKIGKDYKISKFNIIAYLLGGEQI
ncbi:MAG: helix-turn-helix domain-containing protein [Clostridia bacterium]|nr:helix-turn-helix domain-containing protein [Clostridia bacterium]MDD3231828.1 helix-turn-helix domain-containing protein [Clostridia bacterium]MDD4686447.1 helix-turn-helix domain-containing protein [Clostridia bacterium]